MFVKHVMLQLRCNDISGWIMAYAAGFLRHLSQGGKSEELLKSLVVFHREKFRPQCLPIDLITRRINKVAILISSSRNGSTSLFAELANFTAHAHNQKLIKSNNLGHCATWDAINIMLNSKTSFPFSNASAPSESILLFLSHLSG